MKGHWVKQMGTVAQALGLKLQVFDARDLADLEGALPKVAKAQAGTLIVTPSSLFLLHRKRIADFALQRRLPTMAFVRDSFWMVL